MQGLGKLGVHQLKMIEWGMFERHSTNPLPGGRVVPTVIGAYNGGLFSRDADTLKQIIPKNLVHEALLNAPVCWYGTTLLDAPAENQFKKYTYPAEGCPEIHMIWTDSPCWITCWNDSNTYIKGLRSPKIEFILAQHPWMENDCQFADIILPANTKFEEEDITHDSMGGQFYALIRQKKCIEPVGESRSDYEIVCMIAERLGLLKEYTEGKTIEDCIKKGYETAVADSNISLANVNGKVDTWDGTSSVVEKISFEDREEKGYWVLPTDPDWKKYVPLIRKFYDDPENNPLKTPTGKIEFYATGLAKHFPNDKERPPVPHWIEKGESHDERLSSQRAKKYPLLIVSNHGRWRVHANMDDISWTREAPTCKVRGWDGYMYEPLWINPKDAAARDIENGDIIQVFNERGAVLGGAYVTERIMPGTVYMDHGARYDPIIPGELDRGGAINTITPHNNTSKNATGMVVSGYLVEIEKVSLAQMEEWKKKYPEAFRKDYSPSAGLRFDAVVEKVKSK
jgi:trimethylamine-N-oxide reductase (cytochrome c)